MTSERRLRREIEELSATTGGDRPLRQKIPYDLVEEWEEFSGHDLSWIENAGGSE